MSDFVRILMLATSVMHNSYPLLCETGLLLMLAFLSLIEEWILHRSPDRAI